MMNFFNNMNKYNKKVQKIHKKNYLLLIQLYFHQKWQHNLHLTRSKQN